jgi:hypothetical protein
MLPTKFRFFWPSGLREVFKNQKKELPVAAMFVNGSRQNVQSLQRTLHRGLLPSFSSLKCEKLTDDRCQKLTLPLAR